MFFVYTVTLRSTPCQCRGTLCGSAFHFSLRGERPMYLHQTPCRETLRTCRFQWLLPLICLLCLVLLLPACGPQDISAGSSRADADYSWSRPDPLTEIRYPTTGSLNRRREEYFYRLSQPTIFEAVQTWRKDAFVRSLRGISPEDPSYREMPRGRSPFRE